MYALVVALSVVVSTSLIMAAAMAISWSSFGRPAHAVTWAIAFGLNSLQGLSNIAALLTGRLPVIMWLTVVLTLLPCMLIAIGARQRVGMPNHYRHFAVALLAVLMTTIAVALAMPNRLVFVGVPSFFTSAMMVVAVAATMPQGRRPLPAEWASIIADAAFAVIQFAIALLAILRHSDPGNVGLQNLHLSVLGIGLPSAFVGSGIARVLLIASDLAARLRFLSRCDPLTGLLNRRGFEDDAHRVIVSAAERSEPVTVAIADLDHFKVINDRFGHACGDKVLIWFARQLEDSLGGSAIIGRLGGEEFAVLLTEPVQAAHVALEQLRRRVSSDSVALTGVSVSVSLGAAETGVLDTDPVTALSRGLAAADGALYMAKAAGRDRVVVGRSINAMASEASDPVAQSSAA